VDAGEAARSSGARARTAGDDYLRGGIYCVQLAAGAKAWRRRGYGKCSALTSAALGEFARGAATIAELAFDGARRPGVARSRTVRCGKLHREY